MSNLFLILVFMIATNISGAVVDTGKLLAELEAEFKEEGDKQQKQNLRVEIGEITTLNEEIEGLIEWLGGVTNLAETEKIIHDFAQIVQGREEKYINMHEEYAEKLERVQNLKEKVFLIINNRKEDLNPSEEFKKQVFEFLRKIDGIKSHNLQKKTEESTCMPCGKNKNIFDRYAWTSNKIYSCDACGMATCYKCSTKDKLFLHNFPNNKEMVEILGLNKFLTNGTLCPSCNNELRTLLEKMRQNNEYTFEQFKFFINAYRTYVNLYKAVVHFEINTLPNLEAREELLLNIVNKTSAFLVNTTEFRKKSVDLVNYFNPPMSTVEQIGGVLAGGAFITKIVGGSLVVKLSPLLLSSAMFPHVAAVFTGQTLLKYGGSLIHASLTRLPPSLFSGPILPCVGVLCAGATTVKYCYRKGYFNRLAFLWRSTKVAENHPEL